MSIVGSNYEVTMKRAQVRKYVVKCITYMALLLLHTGSAEVQTVVLITRLHTLDTLQVN